MISFKKIKPKRIVGILIVSQIVPILIGYTGQRENQTFWDGYWIGFGMEFLGIIGIAFVLFLFWCFDI